jgi:hypothetical protein
MFQRSAPYERVSAQPSLISAWEGASMAGRSNAGILIAVVAWMALGFSTSAVLADVIAYEGFDYPAGILNGKAGGTGFASAWTSEQDAGLTVDRTNIVADGLTYTDDRGNKLVVTGGRAVSSAGPVTADGVEVLASGAANPFRDVVDPAEVAAIGWQPGTTWWSFLGQRLQPHATLDENVIRASGVQIHDTIATSLLGISPSERLAVGKGTTGAGAAVPEVRYNWGMLHSAAVANQVDSDVPITDSAFIVVRIDHLGTTDPLDPSTMMSDNAYLWVNPPLNEEPQIATADAQFIGTAEFSISRARVFVGGTNAVGPWAEFTWDEYRLGTTHQDVMPFTAAPAGLVGDYNSNNVVDAADYVVWRNNENTMTALPNDPVGGVIGPGQFNNWRANFGASTAGSSAGLGTAVPEPAALVLAMFALLALTVLRRPTS